MKKSIPKNVQLLLKKLVTACNEILLDKLVGVYLHGSLAMGCFNPKSSDIDILIVIKETITVKEKENIGQVLIKLSRISPKNGFEISFILLDTLKNFVYPTPYELHFSNSNKMAFITKTIDFTKHQTDPDIAAHLVITKQRGVCIFGKPITQVFRKIPRKYYLKSIIHDFNWSYHNVMKGKDKGISRVPQYAVLNTCRVLAYVRKDLIMSKAEGGSWGMTNLPKEYRPVIHAALNEYSKSGSSKPINLVILQRFFRYAKGIVRKT